MKKNKLLLLFAFTLFALLPLNVNAMEIFIQPPEGENISLEVESSDTIEAVKVKIFEANNSFLVGEQRLYFNGTELTNGRTLADYSGLGVGSVLKLEIAKVKIIFNANGGLFANNKEEYIIEDYYGKREMLYPTREGYRFEGYYTEKDGGLELDYYDNEYMPEDGMIFYAHWEKTGTETLDFTKIINGANFTHLEMDILKILVDNGILIADQTDKTFKNNSGKILVKSDEEGTLTPIEGLTTEDNIVYTLTNEDKQKLLDDTDEYKESEIPNIVKIIFAEEKVEEYKVIFDANGGSFASDTTYVINNWKNELYDSLIEPTREGYTFKGYYTEKNNGTKFEMILNESGIDSDMTFYAQWEENPTTVPSVPKEENPQTFDGIGNSIINGTISLIVLVGAIIYLKKRKQVSI